ncbi:MAG: nucleotidyltransferase domain-containing protein [Magnetococcus sp. YQC-5]
MNAQPPKLMLTPQKPDELISPQTIDAVTRAIGEYFSPEKIILFGSYANGTPTPDSDLDLIIVMPTELPKYKRSLGMHLLFEPSLCAIDLFLFTPEEVEYWYGTVNHVITNALQSGQIVYER